MKFKFWFFPLLFLFFLLPVQAQSFGKNKIQYKNFKWYYIQSKHFDIYYYPGGEKIAEFTAETAENAYKQLSRDFNYKLSKRVVIIVYNSHNDWQQTNVVIEYLEEGIGGVTELYKNRVVVPFEGSYEQFRHVIHHELVHAVMNDMLYGGSVQSLIMGEVAPVPLWVSEGLAEFESVGWDVRTDMIVRDAVLNNYIPPLQYLEWFLVYQGGNSVFRFIAEKYGREKIGEILSKSRGKVAFNRVLRSTLGLDYKDFTEKWHTYLKRIYLPEIADRKLPREIAKKITNHEKWRNYLNVSPAISPMGDKIAYITDKSGYQEVHLVSAIDGKELKVLIRGQRSESFEELHFLRPGMSFSPDGTKLVLAAKSGPWDALYILDVNSGKLEKHLMKNLDGAFTTSWSPDGKRIAFVGNKDGQSDIYLYHLDSGKIEQLTNDIFTDDQPSWSPDGRYIAFVSDRQNYLDSSRVPPDFKMSNFDYQYRDIYILDLETGRMQRRTNTPWEEATPIFTPDGKKLAFTSDENGIFNLYMMDLATGEYYPVTNIISGIFQIGWDRDAHKMVFSTFYKGGFDIFLLNNPLGLTPVTLRPTRFVQDIRGTEPPVYSRFWEPQKSETPSDSTDKEKTKKIEGETPADFSHYVFGQYRPRRTEKAAKDVELPEQKLKDEFGNYKRHRYKLKFSPDFVTGVAGYNTFYGFQGYTYFAFSDLLGDHKIIINTNLVADLRNSDFNIAYYFLKHRINFGVGGYHLVYFFLRNGYDLIRYRNFGSFWYASYPFNRFKRLDFSLVWYNVFLEYMELPLPTEKVSTGIPELNYVHDNVLWGYRWGILAPVDGSRYIITLRSSFKYNKDGRDFQTIKFDYRRYFKLGAQYSFAFRATAGASFGKNAQQFFLGGIDNWINRKYRVGIRVDRIDDVFFSEFVTPLRGAIYYDRVGDRFFLMNMEFRFPLIEYLKIGFPPISLFNVRGALFYDVGSAWYSQGRWWDFSDFRGFTRNSQGQLQFDDILSGYGVGARIIFLGFLLRFDVAWNFNGYRSEGPLYYWSFGVDF